MSQVIMTTHWLNLLDIHDCAKPESKKQRIKMMKIIIKKILSNIAKGFDDLPRLFFRCVDIKACGKSLIETLH